jgi:hypothetical protein
MDARLDRACASAFDSLRPLAESVRDGRARAVASVRRVSSASGEDEWTSAALTVTIAGLSVVTRLEHFEVDVAWLRHCAGENAGASLNDYRAWPILWDRGSASVLLHEAIGHPAEEAAERVKWPEWLRLRDEPSFRLDDAGCIASSANLLLQPPASRRRATFRDVPILRMTRVVADHENAPFVLPGRRADIHLVASGHYDPLTDQVALTVSKAELVDGSRREPLRPFVIRETRERIRTALAGASGRPVRYPGVICSTDGQRLIVDCVAPLMLTSELR